MMFKKPTSKIRGSQILWIVGGNVQVRLFPAIPLDFVRFFFFFGDTGSLYISTLRTNVKTGFTAVSTQQKVRLHTMKDSEFTQKTAEIRWISIWVICSLPTSFSDLRNDDEPQISSPKYIKLSYLQSSDFFWWCVMYFLNLVVWRT